MSTMSIFTRSTLDYLVSVSAYHTQRSTNISSEILTGSDIKRCSTQVFLWVTFVCTLDWASSTQYITYIHKCLQLIKLMTFKPFLFTVELKTTMNSFSRISTRFNLKKPATTKTGKQKLQHPMRLYLNCPRVIPQSQKSKLAKGPASHNSPRYWHEINITVQFFAIS